MAKTAASALALIVALAASAAAQSDTAGTRSAASDAGSIPVLARRGDDGEIHYYKDPRRARSLSWFIAGAGHIYADEPVEGYTLATLDFATSLAGVMGVLEWASCGPDKTFECTGAEKGLAIGGTAGSFLLSAFAANDAAKIARWNNERYHLGAASANRVKVVASANRLGLAVEF